MIEDSRIKRVLREMEEYEKHWQAVWAVDEETGIFLYEKVLQIQPQKILELGSWRGASAMYLAAALKKLDQGKILSIDRDQERIQQAEENVKKAGLENYVDFVMAEIDDFLANHIEQYDLIFLDAAKKQQAGWLKILLAQNCHDDTVILIDDVITMKDRMQNLYQFLQSRSDIESKIHQVGDGVMEVTLKRTVT